MARVAAFLIKINEEFKTTMNNWNFLKKKFDKLTFDASIFNMPSFFPYFSFFFIQKSIDMEE